MGAVPGAPGLRGSGPPSWPSLCPLFSLPLPNPPTAWDRSPGKLPAGRSRQAWGTRSKTLVSAASDTHRPETSNETSSSGGGGGGSGSRNRTSKMAAPSATPPRLQAEGSSGGRGCLTGFTRYCRTPRSLASSPGRSRVLGPPTPRASPRLVPGKARTPPRTICQGGGDCSRQSDAERSERSGLSLMTRDAAAESPLRRV